MVSAQEIYFLAGPLPGIETKYTSLVKYNAENCQLESIFEFEDEINSGFISPGSLSFHPDGRLYMISESRLIAFNVLTRRIDTLLPLRTISEQPLTLGNLFSYLAISESGRVLISDEPADSGIFRFRYIDYDLRPISISLVCPKNT